jgi:hypothetical protein
MVLGLLAAIAPVRAADGVVSGTGHVSIKRQPQVLRLRLSLSADGKDVNEAIANLKAVETDAGKKLADLAATASSIEFGPAQVPAVPDARQQYMQRIMAQQQGRTKPPVVAPAVTLTCTVTAEWPLKDVAQDQLLATGLALQDKIKSSGLGARAKKLSAEQQELAEEAAAAVMEGGTTNPNEPAFTYVAKVSDDDRAAALADAYKKATANAAQLAKAADIQLGELRQLSRTLGGPAENENPQDAYMRLMMRQAGAADSSVENTGEEATASSPGPVELDVTVTAFFDVHK